VPTAPRVVRPSPAPRADQAADVDSRLFGQNLPCSGGGYFHISLHAVQLAVRHLNRSETGLACSLPLGDRPGPAADRRCAIKSGCHIT
jgi:hypothetical protein